MKNLLITLIFVAFAGFGLQAQTVKISGEQTRGHGSNAKLSSVAVTINKTMSIDKVEGNCAGFWIQQGSVITHKFYDVTSPIGTTLKAGTYTIYPNIKDKQNSANVTITLK
ncbi:MAG: hypothetical protein Q7J34_02485 [Bacteroidales bacterium]|nr:hypothetical protein [Bacteroidales bacterium]